MHYDTELLEQIIETEIDIAAHKLKREKNIIVDVSLKRRWQTSLRDSITHMVARTVHEHVLRPEAVQQFMKQRMDDLIANNLPEPEPLVLAYMDQTVTFSGVTRLLLFFSPFRHKNRDL